LTGHHPKTNGLFKGRIFRGFLKMKCKANSRKNMARLTEKDLNQMFEEFQPILNEVIVRDELAND